MRAVLSAMAWQEIRAKRQAVRDARTLPARLAALCDYQGALAAFVDGHWPELEQRFGQLHIVPAANESAIAPADVAATPGKAIPLHRRTPAEIRALVARARELASQKPRRTKRSIAAELGISAGYLAALLALRP
jgi:hypothetical protein